MPKDLSLSIKIIKGGKKVKGVNTVKTLLL